MRSIGIMAGAVFLAGFGASAGAQELPTLLCAPHVIMECSEGEGCARMTARDAAVPAFLRIDLAAETVTDPQQGDENRSTIDLIDAVDGKVFLHGIDPGVPEVRDGTSWTATISEQTGEMVVSAAGEGVAYLIFGACLVE